MGERSVHLWRAQLDLGTADIAQAQSELDSHELERAAQYTFARYRNRFIAGRAILKRIIAEYLGFPPKQIKIGGASGKIYLDFPLASLQFNMSHSEDLAVYAVTQRREVGVDIERVREELNNLESLLSLFAEIEASHITGMPEGDRLRACFDCWVRKEAVLKLSGEGLATSLKSFEVPVHRADPELLMNSSYAGVGLRAFCPAPGYVGCVACEGENWNVEFYQFQFHH